MFTQQQLEQYTSLVVDFVITYGGKIIVALLVWWIGLFVIKYIDKALYKLFERTNLDRTLEVFIQSLASALLKVILAIIAISILGVQTTSFVALLGAAGLAVGLALQGSLANFAGGALILFFKPFTLGDRISASGFTGTVEEIQIFNTILKTADNRRVILPNGELSNNAIVNITANKSMAVEINVGISYDADIAVAKNIISGLIENHELVVNKEKTLVGVRELADSSVLIFTRSFVEVSDYWRVLFELNESIK